MPRSQAAPRHGPPRGHSRSLPQDLAQGSPVSQPATGAQRSLQKQAAETTADQQLRTELATYKHIANDLQTRLQSHEQQRAIDLATIAAAEAGHRDARTELHALRARHEEHKAASTAVTLSLARERAQREAAEESAHVHAGRAAALLEQVQALQEANAALAHQLRDATRDDGAQCKLQTEVERLGVTLAQSQQQHAAASDACIELQRGNAALQFDLDAARAAIVALEGKLAEVRSVHVIGSV